MNLKISYQSIVHCKNCDRRSHKEVVTWHCILFQEVAHQRDLQTMKIVTRAQLQE